MIGVTSESSGAWAEDCLAVVAALSGGTEHVYQTLASRARSMISATGTAVIVWSRHGPRPLAVSGVMPPLASTRPGHGASTTSNHHLIVMALRTDTDLIAFRSANDEQFRSEDVHVMRVLSTLGATAITKPEEGLPALYEVAKELLASQSREEAQLIIVNAAHRVARAEIAGILFANKRRTELRMEAVVGHRSIETANLRVRLGQGLAGRVFETGTPHRVDDWTTDTSITKEFFRIANVEGTQTAVCVPITAHEEVIGTLCVWRRGRSVFTDDEVELLAGLANLVFESVTRADTAATARRTTRELQDKNRELERRCLEAERTMAIRDQLTELAVAGGGLDSVVTALVDITGTEAVFVSVEGSQVPEVPRNEHLAAVVKGWAAYHPVEVGTVAKFVRSPDLAMSAIVAPIGTAGEVWGVLGTAVADETPSALQVATVEHAATTCALILARREAAAAAVRRVESELIWDLLEGQVEDESEALVRLRQLGHTLPRKARIALVTIPTSASTATDAQIVDRTRMTASRAMLANLRSHGLGVRVGYRGGTVALVLDELERWREPLGATLHRMLSEVGAPNALVGVSTATESLLGWKSAYQQARFALSAAAPASNCVVLFEDLGLLQFLLGPASGADLDNYAERILGTLIAYDATHSSTMVETLGTYMECDCNLQRAAKQLFIHHKTMSYRIARIKSLTGINLDLQESRLNICVALKILGVRKQGD